MIAASLRGVWQFGQVARDGKRLGKGFIQIRFLENSLKLNRIGIVIPAKVSKSAVKRNRIRRLIRESVRHLPPIREGYDIVFMVRALPETDNMHFVKDQIHSLLDSANLLEIRDSDAFE